MWKKVRCAALVSVSRQVEELRSVKAAFLRGQSGPAWRGKRLWADRGEVTWCWGEGGPCAVGAISRPSNCSRGDAVHLLEATYVRECLGSGALGDLTCTRKCPAWKKTCKMSLDWRCSLFQLYFTISLVGLGADHSLFLGRSPVSSLFRSYPFSPPNLFPLFLSTSPHHIHHPTLTSICCLPSISWLVIVFLLGLAGLYSQMVCCLLTNVSGSLVLIIGVAGCSWAGLSKIARANISYF